MNSSNELPPQDIYDRVGAQKDIENYILKVLEKYKGRVFAWDVVNEGFNEDGSIREKNGEGED